MAGSGCVTTNGPGTGSSSWPRSVVFLSFIVALVREHAFTMPQGPGRCFPFFVKRPPYFGGFFAQDALLFLERDFKDGTRPKIRAGFAKTGVVKLEATL